MNGSDGAENGGKGWGAKREIRVLKKNSSVLSVNIYTLEKENVSAR